MNIHSRALAGALLLPAALCLTFADAHAQTAPLGGAVFPSKPVQLIVPFAAGGATDAFARIVGQKLGERWGQTVVIDNKAGATGAIGSTFVARAPADGYTLLVGTASTHSVAPAVNPKLTYHIKDFAPVSLLSTFPNLLVVNPDVPAKNVAELIALLRAQPGKLNFGSTGTGGSVHLAGELFKIATKTDMVHVPFKGSGPALNELLAGRVELAFDNIPAMLPFVQSGKLRALGVTSLARVPSLPNLPAVAETVPGFEATTWIGIFAPAGVPASLIKKIASDIQDVMQLADVKQKMMEQGAVAVGSTPEEFGKFVAADTEKWRRVVKTAGIVAVD